MWQCIVSIHITFIGVPIGLAFRCTWVFVFFAVFVKICHPWIICIGGHNHHTTPSWSHCFQLPHRRQLTGREKENRTLKENSIGNSRKDIVLNYSEPLDNCVHSIMLWFENPLPQKTPKTISQIWNTRTENTRTQNCRFWLFSRYSRGEAAPIESSARKERSAYQQRW